MFRTWVQIWFQLEFPCNVPNLIKLMRGFFFFFPAISTGFPVSVPTSSAQPCIREARASVRKEEVTLHPCCSFCSRTLSRAIRVDMSEVTSSHFHLPPSCLVFLCFPVFSVFWYGQRFGFRNWSKESWTSKEKFKIKQELCVCYQAWGLRTDITVMGNSVTPTYRSSSII